MVVNTAKALRPLLVRALRDGFAERGWQEVQKQAQRFAAPGVESPLSVVWSPDIHGDRYGGLRIGGWGSLRAEEAALTVASFPLDCLPARVAVHSTDPAAVAQHFSLRPETSGGLVDPRGSLQEWLVGSDEQLPEPVGRFFAMVDGPMRAWIDSVTPLARVIELAEGEPERFRVNPHAVSVLLLTEGRPGAARGVVDAATAASADGLERLARFERELAARYPEYGPPQRS